jgi:hypothetical protein
MNVSYMFSISAAICKRMPTRHTLNRNAFLGVFNKTGNLRQSVDKAYFPKIYVILAHSVFAKHHLLQWKVYLVQRMEDKWITQWMP